MIWRIMTRIFQLPVRILTVLGQFTGLGFVFSELAACFNETNSRLNRESQYHPILDI
jgi:hypothetical protein